MSLEDWFKNGWLKKHQTSREEIQDYLDSCRNKRNVSDYDSAGAISKHEVEELIATVQELYGKVQLWVKTHHAEFSPNE